MKAIVCEMCSSQDMVKQDGFFVCQSCGTRYSLEEARKLMVEVEGAVKIDNSDFVRRYLENARRAMSKEDWPEVEKYYNMVEQNDPTNIEAIFYSAYGKAKVSLIENDIYKRQSVFKILTKCVSILDDNYDIEKEAELRDILTKITHDIMAMFDSEFVYTKTTTTYSYGSSTSDNKNETYGLFINLAEEMITTLTNIIAKFPDGHDSEVVHIHKLRLSLVDKMSFLSIINDNYRFTLLNKCLTMAQEIKRLDPAADLKDYGRIIENINKTKETSAEEARKAARKLVIMVIMLVVLLAFMVLMICCYS